MGDLQTRDLTPVIATEVRAHVDDLLAGAFTDPLRRFLIERGVLVFRDLNITLDQQRAITATFGPLRDELQKVTVDASVSPEYAAYFANTYFWHMDGYHGQTVPCFGGSFRPIRICADDGETEFLNAYAAYDSLDERDRQLADGLWTVSSALTSGLAGNPDASDAQVAAWRRLPPARQPLVWQHASGRKSLMLGVAVSHIDGMHPSDSYDLIARLRAQMTRPEHIYRHQWRENDLVIWNNTGTLHRARPFDPDSGRLLHRFTIEGDEPIRAPVPPAAQSSRAA